jgi:O-antigen/teichoic acid export membrane protein
LFLVGKKLSLDILFLALGGTSGLALLIILAVNWKHFCLLPSCWNQLKNVIFKNWQFGRWMLFSNVISWMANQFYILALGMFQPAFVVAQLGVARTIAASSNPLILAYESMGMPRIARIWEVQGAQKTRAYVLMTALWGGGFFILTGSLFFMFPQQAIRFIFGKSFGDISILVKIFSILPFLWFVGKVFSLSILAMHRPKAVLPVYVMACCFTVTGGIWLTYQYGAIGAGIGFLVNGLVLTAGFIYQFLSQIEMAAMEKRHAFATIENAE